MDRSAEPGTERWSAVELTAELGEFEVALRDAGLRDTTIRTYVGRSEVFIRWLTGGYVPRGPVEAQMPSAKPHSALGMRVLEELRTTASRAGITVVLHDYGVLTDYDASLRQLQQATGGTADLSLDAHRTAVLNWLRSWGCRHLRRADEEKTSEVLRAWWAAWQPRLPARGKLITSLSEDDLSETERAYDGLAVAVAAGRTLNERVVDVTFGDTAAAKTLFAVRPDALLPWDAPIRLALGFSAGGGAAYVRLVRDAGAALTSLAARLKTSVDELPATLGRPDSSAAKLVDEYLWIRITRQLSGGDA